MGRDLIIHYDETRQKIICCTVEDHTTFILRSEALPLTSSVDFYKSKTPEEAERGLGAIVFGLLDLYSKSKIGIRDYASIMQDWKDEDFT